MLHCLKFVNKPLFKVNFDVKYQVSSDSQALFSFLEYYDADKILVKNFDVIQQVFIKEFFISKHFLLTQESISTNSL